MKKYLVMLTACMIGAFVLGGCSSESNEPSKPTEVQEGSTVSSEPDESGMKDEADEKKAPETTDPAETAGNKKVENEDADDADDEPVKDLKGLYREILYKYKEAWEGKYSEDQVAQLGLDTELIQYGWPYGSVSDDIGYLYYDLDGDNEEELVITYYDHLMDVYGYDGQKVRLAFSTPYRGISNLYPDGMLRLDFSISAADWRTTWYKYDRELGDYLPVFSDYHEEGRKDSCYTYGYYDVSSQGYKEIVTSYRDTGSYPAWALEWMDEITEEEYEKIVPQTSVIELPQAEKLSDLVLPEDYEPLFPKESTDVPPAVSDGEKIEITKDMQKKLNIFLSNFAEQGMSSYDYGHPDMYRIGYFAFRWSYLNRYKDVKAEGDYYTVSFDTVKNLAQRYLGLDISRDELDGLEKPDALHEGFFRNGDYYIPAADGESYPGFAVVETASDLGADELRLEFVTYDLELELYWDMDDKMMQDFYALTYEEAAAKTEPGQSGVPQLTETGRGYAIVKKDGASYRLRYYEVHN